MTETGGVFRDVIQADIERIPLLEALHVEQFNGGDHLVSQVVVKNVFTDFDRQLSRHLAAIRGEGFPRFTAYSRFRDKNAIGKWQSFEPTHHASVPHALKRIAERAVSYGGGRGILLRQVGRGASADQGFEVPLDREDVRILGEALEVCETFGEPEFMEISGDFEIVICRPSPEQRPITIYLRKGSVTVPSERTGSGGAFDCPIAGFRSHIRTDVGAQGYVAAARHALAAAKEAAVNGFRAAAEEQIADFDRALRGLPLDGHRMESAFALIVRLKEGLGHELRGLNEAARITAREWSLAVDSVEGIRQACIAAGVDEPRHVAL